jgi:8-oxo-dGTP diphosphatase
VTVYEPCVPRVGVGVLLVDELDRVLLTLRNRQPEAGWSSIVGGKLDFFETLEECAAREAREEVGVEVSIQSLLCVTDHCLPQENQHWVSPAYLAKVRMGTAVNSASRKRPRTSNGSRSIACLPT